LSSAKKLGEWRRGSISKEFGTTIPKYGPLPFILSIFSIIPRETAPLTLLLLIPRTNTRKPSENILKWLTIFYSQSFKSFQFYTETEEKEKEKEDGRERETWNVQTENVEVWSTS
jgi:hypothetical protein